MDLNYCETYNCGQVALNRNMYNVCLHYGHKRYTYTFEYYALRPNETLLQIEI